jgi:hypothetical protein
MLLSSIAYKKHVIITPVSTASGSKLKRPLFNAQPLIFKPVEVFESIFIPLPQERLLVQQVDYKPTPCARPLTRHLQQTEDFLLSLCCDEDVLATVKPSTSVAFFQTDTVDDDQVMPMQGSLIVSLMCCTAIVLMILIPMNASSSPQST